MLLAALQSWQTETNPSLSSSWSKGERQEMS